MYDNASIALYPENAIIGPDSFRQMAEHPNIHGIKASSGDLRLFHEYERIARETGGKAFIGNEKLMSKSISRHAVPSMANIFPQFCREFMDVIAEGSREQRREYQRCMDERGMRIYSDYTKIHGGIMYALKIRGICCSEPLGPDQELTCKEKKDIALYVSGLEDRMTRFSDQTM
ncbi:hypothetical protein GF345_06400 [Candidatus Woesearchaeota archaeon]|nr:hypothetical protein [Candidatus Woesearchaeota archaeon]